MIRSDGQPIVGAEAMRAVEQRAIDAGTSVEALMERAGAAVAEAVRRLAGGAPVLLLCGPGNNGGDGYVAARLLKANGLDVRLAALSAPKTEAAKAARAGWDGPVEDFAALAPDASHGAVLVDALFGTGLTRPLAAETAALLATLTRHSHLAITLDVPSGVDTDTGAILGEAEIPPFALTLALGALKPAHVLQRSAALCGTVRVLDIGLDATASHDWTLARPKLAQPTPAMHKYSRGLVVVIGGTMPGAAALAASAAMHVGAGYTALLGAAPDMPHALVQRAWSPEALAATLDGKKHETTAIIVGPGLGKGADAAEKLEHALASGYRLVIDGDALHQLDAAMFDRIKARDADAPVILTPHAGEFHAVFGAYTGSKIDAARASAARSGAIVVFKGPDTVIAYPDGRTRTATHANPWLSTAGTGDVLAGTIGAMLASSALHPVEAGVWLHAEAARRLGAAFLADDLAAELSKVRGAL
ncbi:NAD(P)H-hydrate dehydratase [Sphingomonas sp. AAP5]|uniref:NAD(P)H-hydrate dehydratase n=1 Tax=Sphingomonas sp. AAP5 TaxID=1523415 RepID=UPI0010570566|nr:NAD(P)H-hydrate dehydratase [Sphingomonas sp. AAP5]QBM75338.1 NAD(P)H-hydrate dehydratase [Sphingomonas sp. AAP5]